MVNARWQQIHGSYGCTPPTAGDNRICPTCMGSGSGGSGDGLLEELRGDSLQFNNLGPDSCILLRDLLLDPKTCISSLQ
ncbi:hypothetical protein CHARACLAT_018545 [Characodon lateralis]|uniref:Uncharacterized protein n=1 Tax=Characodon lateralis TaxID=208331 RepID=A0ABU7DVS1_9TELE|nr:hypothetical protein [Characodon lateralis]